MNGSKAVKTARALDEGQDVVIEVETNRSVDPENDGEEEPGRIGHQDDHLQLFA